MKTSEEKLNKHTATKFAAVLTGEASDRFERLMKESEKCRGAVDFSKEIEITRDILRKAYLSGYFNGIGNVVGAIDDPTFVEPTDTICKDDADELF